MEGTRIGPYLVTGPLGAGGMGEVYAAWDERLERSVAIKRVTPDPTGAAPDPRRRERLRREAQAAGRLSHPSIVQIYDVVESEEADWIVLELVEGPALAELLRQGPLPLGRLLPLAAEIAEGLAEAHDRGILHRDLKTENVVVTRSGHAKILDFGLAKRFWPAAAPEAGDGLSRDGEIVGTPRAMSPEQANGEALDPRSDLFSLGTLLYEAVTGVSPFLAATPVETLHRVCTHQPPPVVARNPAVPLPLSELIRELLEKDRERRPADAHRVAARLAALQESRGSGARHAAGALEEPTLAEILPAFPVRRARVRRAAGGLAILLLLLLLVAGLVWALRLRHREPLYVAVAEPQVLAAADGGPETALAAAALRSALWRDLSGLDRVAVLTPEPGDSAAPRVLARQLAADEVLVTRLDCPGEAGRVCRVSLSRLQAADGRLLWSEGFEVPADDVALIAAAVGPALRRGYAGFSPRPGAASPETGREDWERFVRLEQDFWEHRGDSPSRHLLADVEALRQRAPRFVEVLLLEADLYLLRFFASRDPADAERARGLLAEARRLAPGDPRPAWLLARVALNAGPPGAAEAAVAELARQIPGDNRVQVLQSLLAERQGRPDEALERMRAAARRRPGQANLLGLANLESRLGRMDDARHTLAALLARFPNDRNARSFLAQLELGSGSVETAARLYAELVRAELTYTELSNLGVAQLLLGRYEPAAASFRQALGLLPQSPAAVLNLADAEWLRGRKTEAAALYGKVIDLAARDPAPAFWQTQTLRAQALAHLGRREEAVDAVQQALRAAPDNPQVAYESSLVYALVGETASARVTAQRARAAGYDRRWFSFPWFDSLGRER